MSFGANLNLAGQIFPITIGYVYDPIGMSYVPAQQAGGGTAGAVSILDGLDVAQGSRLDAAWDGVAASASVVSILKKIAASGGGGGGAVTIADGADVTQGAKADAAWDLITGSPTIVALLKKAAGLLDSIRVSLAGTLVVTGPLSDAQLRASAIQVDVADEDTRLLGRAKLLDSGGSVIDPAKEGADIAGAAMPAGGVGSRGWLSALYTKLAASIAVTGTVAVSNMIPAVETGLAKEAGGNLAAIAANTGLAASATNQASELTALALLDTDLKAELGLVGMTPGAYTVLDRLNALAQKIDRAASTNAQDATLKQLIAAVRPAPGQSAVRATLLHR